MKRSKKRKKCKHMRNVVYLDDEPLDAECTAQNSEALETVMDVLTIGFLGLSLISGGIALYNSTTQDAKK